MLLGILVHDRPALLSKCLQALPQSEHTLVLYGDNPESECAEIAGRVTDGIWINSSKHLGIAHGLNQILRFRKPSEDFCWLASDTVLESPDWLARLQESPYDISAPRYACGVWFFRGYVVDVLGGFRVHGGTYGGVDGDYLLRADSAGYLFGEVPMACETPPETNRRGVRREQMEQAVKALQRLEPVYRAGQDLYEPLVQ